MSELTMPELFLMTIFAGVSIGTIISVLLLAWQSAAEKVTGWLKRRGK